MNFPELLKKIREEKGLRVVDVAKKAGMSPDTIWKAERGYRHFGMKIMTKACLKGLGLTLDSPEFKQLNAAWVEYRSGIKISPGDLAERISASRLSNNDEATRFFKDVAALSSKDFKELAKAVKRPSVLELVRAANAVYEAK